MSNMYRASFAAIALTIAPLASAADAVKAETVTLDGIIHADGDDTLAFTPDGNMVLFDRSEGSRKTVMVSHRTRGHWSQPRTASFSGQWFDQDPVVAPDGSYLVFNSDRPVRSGGKSLTQNYFGGVAAPGANLWRVDRTRDGWGAPVWLGPVVNNDAFIDFASIAGDGTLYFQRWNAAAQAMQFWRSAYKKGAYQPPARVILGDPARSLHDASIAKDQAFIVFDYGKVKGGLGRLSIAFRKGDGWGEVIDLGAALNEDLPWGSHLAPDGHTLYVTGRSGIWRISLDAWLDAEHRVKP